MVCTDGNKVRVHPRNQQNQFVRINGWTRPIHYLQVIAWVVLFLFSLVYFGVVAIAVVTPWKPAAYVCVGILLLLHVAAHLAATTKNPGDENARAQIKQNHQMPDFDRSKHEHVIENEYCNLCETYVNKESKHCRACNKCVKHFDHHCLWLNNCVGQRNYRYFFTTISTAFLGSLVIVIVSLFVFINSLMEFQYLDPNVWWKSVSPPLFQAFIGVLIVLCIICCALLGQLFFFHLLLIRRGITTYDYIQISRAKKQQNSTGNINSAANIAGDDVTEQDVACSTPSEYIGTEVNQKKDEGVRVKIANGVADNSVKLDSEDNMAYDTPAVIVPSAFVTDTTQNSSPRNTQTKVKSSPSPSEFTNAAFTPEETRNINANSNAVQIPQISVNGSIHSQSSLGELRSWEATNILPKPSAGEPVMRSHNSKGHISPERPASGLSDSIEADDQSGVNGNLVTNSVDSSTSKSELTSSRRHHQKRSKRHSKKAMMLHRDDGAPRPLPVLPENSNNPLGLNGIPRLGNSPSRLPPLRNSVDWASSTEDLQSYVASGRKLPPLSASSSMTSLASYMSGSIASSQPPAHPYA